MSETIIRVAKNKENPYVMINKTCLNDVNLTLKAKGLHSYLLTLPDDWKVYVSELTKHFKDGRDSISSAIKELEKNGYIKKDIVRNEKGHYKGYSYTIFEKPEIGNTENGKSVMGESVTTNKELKLNNNKLNNNNNNVAVDSLSDLIFEKTGFKINAKTLSKLIKDKGNDKILEYTNNWHKFDSIDKKNAQGFFVKAIQEEYQIPKHEAKISNYNNFKQREYSAEYFEKFYYNNENDDII